MLNIIEILLALSGLFLLYHIIIIMKVTFRVKEKKNYVSVTYEHCEFEMVPGLNQELFESMSEKFKKNGFEFEDDYKIAMGTSNATIFCRRFINKEKSNICKDHMYIK